MLHTLYEGMSFFPCVAMVDYTERNATLEMGSVRECFQIPILNDNISEPVEIFLVSLDTATPGVDFINRTLTVVIIDDGRPQCSSYLSSD